MTHRTALAPVPGPGLDDAPASLFDAAARLALRRVVCRVGFYAPAHGSVIARMRATGFDPYAATRDELATHAAAVLDVFTTHWHALEAALPRAVLDDLSAARLDAEAVFRVLDAGTVLDDPPAPGFTDGAAV